MPRIRLGALEAKFVSDARVVGHPQVNPDWDMRIGQVSLQEEIDCSRVLQITSILISRGVFVCAPWKTLSRLWCCVIRIGMMRPIESSNLRVDGIIETCINVAEINRAREFYQLL